MHISPESNRIRVRNLHNAKCAVSKSKYGPGVYAMHGKYSVHMRVSGIVRYFGLYNTVEEAQRAYRIAEKEFYGQIL